MTEFQCGSGSSCNGGDFLCINMPHPFHIHIIPHRQPVQLPAFIENPVDTVPEEYVPEGTSALAATNKKYVPAAPQQRVNQQQNSKHLERTKQPDHAADDLQKQLQTKQPDHVADDSQKPSRSKHSGSKHRSRADSSSTKNKRKAEEKEGDGSGSSGVSSKKRTRKAIAPATIPLPPKPSDFKNFFNESTTM